MDSKHILIIEGGDSRLPEQPRGYHLWVRTPGEKDEKILCYSVIHKEGKYYLDEHDEILDCVKRIDVNKDPRELLMRSLGIMYFEAVKIAAKTNLPVRFKLDDKEIAKETYDLLPFHLPMNVNVLNVSELERIIGKKLREE